MLFMDLQRLQSAASFPPLHGVWTGRLYSRGQHVPVHALESSPRRGFYASFQGVKFKAGALLRPLSSSTIAVSALIRTAVPKNPL